ncbi:hypothetical protein [Amycolatopsis sp. NPDC001319]|uniref:hypothetical protein n=1 Tax=Amycolatopsis sp. NPDC001319 TaxID=3363922 RepID=UPI003682B149
MTPAHRRVAVAAALVGLFATLTACGPTVSAVDPPMAGAPPVLFDGAAGIYVDPDNPAAAWLQTAPSGTTAEVVRSAIAGKPAAVLIASPAVAVATRAHAVVAAATAANAIPVLLADADQAGACPSGYSQWFSNLANGLGQARALVVVRAGQRCAAMPSPAARARLLTDAVHTLARASHTTVLIDVTDAPSPAAAADLAAGSDGAALNIGRYAPDDVATANAQAIRRALIAKTGRTDYLTVIDSSRNGAAVSGDCNPPNARTGQNQLLTSDRDQSQQLWLTTPGISDGPCGIAPASQAGEFVPELAVALAQRPS